MKTAKEFIERLSSDEAFAKEVNDAVLTKKDAGAPDYADAIVSRDEGFLLLSRHIVSATNS